MPDIFLSYYFASLDALSIMIDRNYTVIVNRGQIHCLFLENVIIGKVLLSHRFNKSNRPLVFSHKPLPQEVETISKVDSFTSKNCPYIWHYNIMSHMSLYVISWLYPFCAGYNQCTVMYWYCFTIEALVMCNRGNTLCNIISMSSQRLSWNSFGVTDETESLN